jgi:hypothetical protein
MTFNQIFTAYYSLYRADSDAPVSGDDEHTVGIRLANEAISRWENYDNTYWKELYETNQSDGSGSQTISTGQQVYDAPDNFRESGGFVRVLAANGSDKTVYPIIEPSEVQSKTSTQTYCYFKGNPSFGYTLNLNPAPTSENNGLNIEYDYYKAATQLTADADITEMTDPYFIVHRMLSSQFRAARNPYYGSAKSDAENLLGQMKMNNDTGGITNPPTLKDLSGSVWGGSTGNSFFGGR